MKDRYVIRAKGGAGGYVFWMADPFEDDAGVKYYFASHPSDAAHFEDERGEQQAKDIVSALPIKHAKPHVVLLETALDEHALPPAQFPFNVFSIPTDDELKRTNEPDDIKMPSNVVEPQQSELQL